MSRRLPLIAAAALAVVMTAQAPTDPERAVADALRANPLLAPYPIRVTTGSKGEIVLSGRVGSKAAHDAVVRTVIDMDLAPRDDLVIDTSLGRPVVYRETMAVSPVIPGMVGGFPYYQVYPTYETSPAYPTAPPYWNSRALTSGERLRRLAAPAIGDVRITADELGRVHLSGEAATEADKRRIEQEAAGVPGVTGLSSDLKVAGRPTPPPPPPGIGAEPAIAAPAAADAPAARVERSPRRSPALIGSRIETTIKDGVATIRGEARSALEAMAAFRAARETPGAREVVDETKFPLPAADVPNPLIGGARPDDLEPYLLHRLRRRIGDAARVDHVRVLGGVVRVRGEPAPGESRERIEGIVRSAPLLRGFKVETDFAAD